MKGKGIIELLKKQGSNILCGAAGAVLLVKSIISARTSDDCEVCDGEDVEIVDFDGENDTATENEASEESSEA